MRSRFRRLAGLAHHALAVLGVAWLVQTFVLEVSVATSSCMAPTLVGRDRAGERADHVVVDRLRRGLPSRFSIVSIVDDEGYPIVKRVVGLPGETIVLRRDRTLLIDGRVVEAPAGVGHATGERGYLPCGNLSDERPYVVPEQHVYVLGDDTGDSQDSRFTGAVPASSIRGRVILAFRLWDRLEVL